MSAEERREARRKRILENSEIRLKKIISVTVDEHAFNDHLEFLHDNPVLGNSYTYPDLPDWTISTSYAEQLKPNIEEKRFFNHKSTNVNSILHSKFINYEIKFSKITILHIILSQIVLALFYYDLGFLFGNTIVLPFLLSAIPELYSPKKQNASIHMIVLSMMGLSRNSAKRIAMCVKLTTVIFKQFCIYIFCFTCSYALFFKPSNVFYDFQHDSSLT